MNEIKRLQQLAGIITEIKVNNPIYPYFNEWKEDNILSMQDQEYEPHEILDFKDQNTPEDAVNYLINIGYLDQNDFDHNLTFIKTGLYPKY